MSNLDSLETFFAPEIDRGRGLPYREKREERRGSVFSSERGRVIQDRRVLMSSPPSHTHLLFPFPVPEYVICLRKAARNKNRKEDERGRRTEEDPGMNNVNEGSFDGDGGRLRSKWEARAVRSLNGNTKLRTGRPESPDGRRQ